MHIKTNLWKYMRYGTMTNVKIYFWNMSILSWLWRLQILAGRRIVWRSQRNSLACKTATAWRVLSNTVTMRVWFGSMNAVAVISFLITRCSKNNTNRICSMHLAVTIRKVFCCWHRYNKSAVLELALIFQGFACYDVICIYCGHEGNPGEELKIYFGKHIMAYDDCGELRSETFPALSALALYLDYRDVQQRLSSFDTKWNKLTNTVKTSSKPAFFIQAKMM